MKLRQAVSYHGAQVAMPFTSWFQPPRRLPLLFLSVALIPVLALGWLTRSLVQKDRDLGRQRAQERVEHAADRAVAAAHQRLSELEGQLQQLGHGDAPDRAGGTILVVAEGDSITVTPSGALVFFPILPAPGRAAPGTFAEGERLEFQQGDLRRAGEWFRMLAPESNPAVRAGALVRLGRTQKKSGQRDAALATYAELATLGATLVEGFPAAVLALQARCEILEAAGRRKELAADARALRDGLAMGKWPLQRDAHAFYSEQARRLTGERAETEADLDARAVAAGFQSIWQRWKAGGVAPQREWLTIEGRPMLAASTARSSRLTVLLAGAAYLQSGWSNLNGFHAVLTDGEGRAVLGQMPDVSLPQAVRTTDRTRLPWTLRVASSSGAAGDEEAAMRFRLLLTGSALVLVLFVGGGYFTLRGVNRELAAARLQSDFVAAVSHEFRTPLASVRHLSEMLSSNRVADETQRQQCYEHLSRESERLERLVEELLDFGRIEGGEYRYQFEPIDVSGFVRELVDEFQANVTPTGYRVELSGDVKGATARGDRQALARAIWNLLENAMKYSPGSDTIWVALSLERNSVVVRVRDRGLGIPLSEQQAIFRKFVRGSNARTEQIKGTGIGLAMVHHIMEAHQGEVRVESQPNEGSTFALLLPVLEGPNAEHSHR